MKTLFTILLVMLSILSNAQNTDNQSTSTTLGESLLQGEEHLKIGGYGHVDYNQTISTETINNGKLDVHRLVILMGYQFNKKTGIVTEIEFEHVQEVFVEQAYLNHKLTKLISLRAGLLLVPMGILNEYHEPVLYHGVERPLLENNLNPTTWREIGLGIAGRSDNLSLKYQLYMMNGVLSYKTAGLLNASGFRGGRQKGAESIQSSPNFTGRVEFYGLPGLKIGASGWYGKTQSSLYQGISKDNESALPTADSSVVGMSMLGLDCQYQKKGVEIKAQYYLTGFENTIAYNEFTGSNLAKTMQGFYTELGYNLLYGHSDQNKLVPFVRYSAFNTQASMESGFVADLSKKYQVITAGIGWFPAKGAVLKADYEWVKTASAANGSHQLNMGIGFMF